MPTLNKEQTSAVYIDENAVIVAGAGGGKTTVLASRVLRLLVDKQVSLSKILLLTFTNKASAEMTERVYKLLESTIESRLFLGNPLSNAQIQFLLHEQEHFQQSTIMTLDAFCLRIAKIGMSRLGNIQTLTIESDLEPAIERFAEQWLLSHPQSELKSLLHHYPFSSLVHNIVCKLLKDCSCFSLDLEAQLASILEELTANIAHAKEQILENIAELHKLFSNIAIEQATNSVKKLFSAVQDIAQIVQEDYKALLDTEIRLSLVGVTSSTEVKPMAEEVKHVVANLKLHCTQITMYLTTLQHKSYYQRLYGAMQVLVDDWNAYRKNLSLYSYGNIAEIARYTLEQYADIRRWYCNTYNHIIIDEFQDNNLDQKHLLYLLSGEVAEPQPQFSTETIVASGDIEEESSNQFAGNVLSSATGKTVYFFVGDPKQSIYAFRGADIQAFLSLKQDNTALSMLTNYRSRPRLIALFNDWFSKLFADEKIQEQPTSSKDELNIDYIGYEAQAIPQVRTLAQTQETTVVAGTKQDASTEADMGISLLLSPKEQQATTHFEIEKKSCLFDLIQTDTSNEESEHGPIENNAHNNEALIIAQRIRTMQDNGIALEDIAVLSRTKAIFSYIASHLIEMDIAYHIEDNVLNLRQDVGRDFFAWLTLLVLPEDKSIYAAVLRSPIANVSDNTVMVLLALSEMSSEMPTADTLFTLPKDQSALAKYFAKQIAVSEELQEDMRILESLAQKYAQARALVKEGRIEEVLAHFWLECGYRIVLLRNVNYHVFLMQYQTLNTLIITYRDKGAMYISEKLRSIVSGETTGIESQSAGENKGVQLLTIHKSKGLEFPYVILAHTHANVTRSAIDATKVCKHKNRYYIDFSTPNAPHYLLQKQGYKNQETVFSRKIQESKKKQNSELLRILYVALTRAEKAIILCGYFSNHTEDAKQTKSTYLDWLDKHAYIPMVEEDTESSYHANEHSLLVLHDERLVQMQLQDQRTKNIVNQKAQSNTLIKKIDTVLANSKLLERIPRRQEVSPSSGTAKSSSDAEKSSNALPSISIDAILNIYNLHTAFGTYCHFLLNYYCKNTKPDVLPLKLESQLLPLSAEELAKFVEESKKLCERFLQSEIWQGKSTQARVYTEYPFLLWNDTHQVRVRGIIDLLIIEANAITIVDYKVDKHKHPENYQYQLASYRLAMQKQFAIDSVSCNLFYLRSGETIPHTFAIAEDDLVQYLLTQGEDSVKEGEVDISALLEEPTMP